MTSLWNKSFFLRWTTADPSPRGNFTPPTKQECGETLGDLEPVYALFPTHIYILWLLYEADRFFYGESPRTPPLEGTSLHRRNVSVERPWGILSLFATCYKWIHLARGCVTDKGVFVRQVVFLTVNRRGPLPLRELHSTDETRMWRDPGGSWACLRPVTSEFTQFVFLTLNHRGLLFFWELHSTDEMIVRRDPGGSWACLRLQVKSSWQRLRHIRPTRELITHQSPEHSLLRRG